MCFSPSKSSRDTLCLVVLRLACDPINKSAPIPRYSERQRSAQPGARPRPGSAAPLSVPEIQRVCGSWRRGVERPAESVLHSDCVAGVGQGSACDSVVCVCLASASLSKQWLGWALLRGVFTVGLGRGCERVRRGRGPSSSTTTPPASAGRAAGEKRPERNSEARNSWGGGVGSGDLPRWGCFSVWQLLLAASPLEKG